MRAIRKISFAVIAVLATSAVAAGALAKLPDKVLADVLGAYPPAIDSKALQTAHEKIDPTKMRGYVVVERGGIPAERARFFISWSDYDYRGVVVHVGDEGRMTTRRGTPYTYLRRGDIMAVTGVKEFRDTVYLKLMSADVYVPANRQKDKRHSRVTVMLGFKFPKSMAKSDGASEVLDAMASWVKPFNDEGSAKAYAAMLRDENAMVAAESARPEERPDPEEERIKSLEDKIDAAKKDLEDAEKELGEIKGSKGK